MYIHTEKEYLGGKQSISRHNSQRHPTKQWRINVAYKIWHLLASNGSHLMWEEGSVPISVLLISVTMFEIATDIHSWSASILWREIMCVRARVCTSQRHMLHPSCESHLSTQNQRRACQHITQAASRELMQRWAVDIFSCLQREFMSSIIWLRFGKSYWRDKLALERRRSFEGSAPCWIRCFNTW